ncbi:MAG: pyridoxine 5'-phosphate synthase [Planctomycetota bacterium]|jgi:pyridoxine 5-phosphate synthase
MVRLSVNVDHVATLRNARGTPYPDPVHLAVHALNAGADGITVHLREDRRHIRERDVELLRPIVPYMTLEMAARVEMIEFAKQWRPDLVTLVPEKREELTTEGGLDPRTVKDAVSELREAGLEVCLFIDPTEEFVRAAHDVGAPCVELHTGRYAEGVETELGALAHAARLAADLGLEVHAGHGLTAANAGAVAMLPQVTELSIGHSIVSRALQLGFEGAVLEMREAIGG